jgi:hypothetical protein
LVACLEVGKSNTPLLSVLFAEEEEEEEEGATSLFLGEEEEEGEDEEEGMEGDASLFLGEEEEEEEGASLFLGEGEVEEKEGGSLFLGEGEVEKEKGMLVVELLRLEEVGFFGSCLMTFSRVRVMGSPFNNAFTISVSERRNSTPSSAKRFYRQTKHSDEIQRN